jgi:hypothetical protein
MSIYESLLLKFDNSQTAMDAAIQPVSLGEDEDGNIVFVPFWYIQDRDLEKRLTCEESTQLELLFLDRSVSLEHPSLHRSCRCA